MERVVEFVFKKNHTNYNDAIDIEVRIGDCVLDSCSLCETSVKTKFYDTTYHLLGIEPRSIDGYLKIPEIKALHDEHFKKEVDLFCYNVEKVFYVDRDGTTEFLHKKNYDFHDLINELKNNYNLFPTEELCEKARPMSLDERKQLLFANAKGYEVLTREEITKSSKIVLFDYPYLSMDVDGSYGVYHSVRMSNIRFVNSKHAKECADFMNESSEVSE